MPFDLSPKILIALVADVREVRNLIDQRVPAAGPSQAERQDCERLGRHAEIMRDLVRRAMADPNFACAAGQDVIREKEQPSGRVSVSCISCRD